MPERRLPRAISPIAAVLGCVAVILGGAAAFVSDAAAGSAIGSATMFAAMAQDGSSVSDSSSPETAPPDDTPPDTTETAPPAEPPPDEPPPDGASESTEPLPPDSSVADDDNLVLGVIAIAGFTFLVAVAGWWMARRRDIDDGAPPRPTPDAGVAGRDLI